MNNVFEYKDESLGTCYIVVSKIRELHMSFGELAITFDGGEKKVISVDDPDGALRDLLAAIEKLKL